VSRLSSLHREKWGNGIFVLNPDNGVWVIVNSLGDRILSLLETGMAEDEIPLDSRLRGNDREAATLESGLTEDEIPFTLSRQYNMPVEEIKRDVDSFLNHLKKQGFFSPGIPGDGEFSGLYLEVTGRCNLSCRYCYNSPPVPVDMPEEAAFSLVRQAEKLGAKFIVLGGGEPLLYPGIWRLLEYASPRITTALVTNGILLSEEICSRLAEIPGLSIQLSLEGVDPEIHEAMRGKGSFRPAWQGLLSLLDRGMGDRITLCFTLNKYNAGHFPRVLEEAEQLGVGSILVQPLGKIGNAVECWDEIAPDHFESIAALKRLDEHPLPVYGILPRSLREIFLSHTIRTRCPLGEKLNVTFNGDVYPCSQLSLPEFRLGNIKDQTLLEILEGEKLKSLQAMPQKRIRQVPECESCPWRKLCAGGCPASSILECGSLNSLDPHCDLIRMFFSETAKEMATTGGKT